MNQFELIIKTNKMQDSNILSNDKLLEEIKQYATNIILDFPDTIVYHDINYTQRLVSKVNHISETENLSEEETKEALMITWLFATSFKKIKIKFTDSHFEDNLSESAVDNASVLFKKLKIEDTPISKKILNGLHNVNLPNKPQTNVEKVVADAITADLVSTDDDTILKKVYQEILLQDVNLSKSNWYDVILEMGSKVSFHTKYGREEIQPRLEKVMRAVKKEQKGIENKTNKVISKELEISDKELAKLKKKVRAIKGRDDRAIQTLFRTTSKNHYTLNEMVDRKASIMITVNSIILSLVISGIIGGDALEHSIHYIPVALLALTSISSIIFAILSILPNRTQGTFTEEEIRGKKGNLLYFGNFHEMKQRDYEWGVLQMMNDSEYLYSSMVRDIYYLGKILYSKYSLIRWSLRIFLGGLILSLLAFTIIRSMVHLH